MTIVQIMQIVHQPLAINYVRVEHATITTNVNRIVVEVQDLGVDDITAVSKPLGSRVGRPISG
jgi:hypothetical protein